jgi:hypothetical protein
MFLIGKMIVSTYLLFPEISQYIKLLKFQKYTSSSMIIMTALSMDFTGIWSKSKFTFDPKVFCRANIIIIVVFKIPPCSLDNKIFSSLLARSRN